MATWQFSFFLIPESWVTARFGEVPERIDRWEDVASEAWRDDQPATDPAPLVLRLLPESKSWHDELSRYGDDDGDRIEIWSKENRVTEISVRIDLRDLSRPLIEGIIDLAATLRTVVLLPISGTVLRPDTESLLAEIRRSDAARFVVDPGKYFNDLSKNPIPDELTYELWMETAEDGCVMYTFFPVDKTIGQKRRGLGENAKLIWTVQASSWDDASQKQHEYLGWEDYKPMEPDD